MTFLSCKKACNTRLFLAARFYEIICLPSGGVHCVDMMDEFQYPFTAVRKEWRLYANREFREPAACKMDR